MKVFSINTCNFGSTGKIMVQIQRVMEQASNSVWIAYAKSRSNMKSKVNHSLYIGTILERNFHIWLTNFTGFNGCGSYFSTLRFLHKVKKYSPDVIHLHNLHNAYINVPMLFRYIKKHQITVVWTLHDCWAFTGQCAHFTMIGCDRWKEGCHNCPQCHVYPKSFVDRTKTMWKLKRKWFTGVENMTIVTPSCWLGDLVKQSYLGNYPIKVINNGIDLNVFRPTISNFREKHGLQDKYILLGVAFGWDQRKGFDFFLELAARLDDSYQIVLVGTDNAIDAQLPDNVISIHRTQNQTELAELYTAADVLVNPTREENYPTVNMEAIACGTPVVTFRTGGSPEIIDAGSGMAVDCNDIDGLQKAIEFVRVKRPFTTEQCLARAKSFDMNERFQEYVDLYKDIGGIKQ
ncbi:MAG: glycosyltransferase [Oscillospiraceae bacterium]|nr:glycosyltransferase [Oscillospiraceae bacterium]